ncbi:amidohydrolase family protein [Niallia sp. Man26]|uniref:amidohydrolase family protein n=1 Tax=Niallia sp. Man26 TaxID=2912824 RepID=UPI001EDC240F|nr:amidohydrolase family protein [Niallia sp. Man26]UPO91071.1 amidohydrolase family protein [Niallia sp. Man26]
MIIDAHVHIKTDEEGFERSDIKTVLRKMDENGIDKVVCFTLGSGLEKQKILAELVKPYADRFIPIAFINPNDPDAKEQLLYALDTLGFNGVKMHPWFSNFSVANIELLRPIFEILDERKLYAVIHCTSEDYRVHPVMFERLGNTFPNVTIQMAHMGEVMAGEYAIDVAKRVPNVYLDTSITSFMAVTDVLEQCPDKVFMGTDYPFYEFSMEIMKQKLAAEEVNKHEEMKMIMGGNFQRVFGLKK